MDQRAARERNQQDLWRDHLRRNRQETDVRLLNLDRTRHAEAESRVWILPVVASSAVLSDAPTCRCDVPWRTPLHQHGDGTLCRGVVHRGHFAEVVRQFGWSLFTHFVVPVNHRGRSDGLDGLQFFRPACRTLNVAASRISVRSPRPASGAAPPEHDPHIHVWYRRIKLRRGSKVARVAVMRRITTT